MQRENELGQLRCLKCDNYKDLDDFFKDTHRADGRKAQCKMCHTEAGRNGHLKKLYGITIAEYDALWKSQGEGCAICGRSQQTRRFPVDHDHETGAVRGILCDQCNLGLGHANDSISTLEAMVAYLKRQRAA